MATRRKKKRPARNRGTTASQRTSTVKRKATELSSDSSEPATRRPATGAGSSPRPLQTKNVTGVQAASGGRQLVSPVPAGQRQNKTPIFITGVFHTRGFLTSLRASCPYPLTAQLKAENLMVVPSTADGFRATVSALRSLDGKEGVSFHNFSLPEDRCVRLLVKNLGTRMSESVVREELEALDIRVQGVMQLRSVRRDQGPAKDRPPLPTLSYLWREGLRCPGCGLSPSSAVCESRWRRTWRRRAPCNVSAASASDIRSVTADTCFGASRVGELTSLVSECPVPRGQPKCCSCGGRPHRELPGLREMERGEGGSCKAGAWSGP
jgi:hypothetical protein